MTWGIVMFVGWVGRHQSVAPGTYDFWFLLRCCDIPQSHRSKRAFIKVLAIIPGPQEPASMRPYMQPIIDEFLELQPGASGMLVRDSATGRVIQHHAVLAGCHGDTPASKKLQQWLSHASFLGCGYCYLRGDNTSGTMRFLGYSTDTACGHMLPGFASSGSTRCGDPTIILTEEDQRQRAAFVETAPVRQRAAIAKLVGCHGKSVLVEQLPYCTYTGLWLVPIAHACLFGAVKSFWNLLLKTTKKGDPLPWYSLRPAARRLLSQRATEIHVTNDFNRPYRDIVSKRGLWTMEDYLHFAETFSTYLLRPEGTSHVLHDARLRQMWLDLQTFVRHHFRSLPQTLDNEEVGQARNAASEALLRYSCAAQEHFEGTPLCTYNLHVLNCRLPTQQVTRGHTSFYGEWWVEYLVQLVKSTVRGRATTSPELVAVNDLQLAQKLHLTHSCHSNLKTVDELIPEWDSGNMQGYNLDMGHAGLGLLGSGRSPRRRDEMGDVIRALQQYLNHFPSPEWDGIPMDKVRFTLYQHAYKGATQEDPSMVLQSESYRRARSRMSCYVSVVYEEAQGLVTYVAHVKYFMVCQPPAAETAGQGEVSGDGSEDEHRDPVPSTSTDPAGANPASSSRYNNHSELRIAVSDLYRAVEEDGLYKVTRFGNPEARYTGYPVELGLFRRKLMHMGKVGAPLAYFSRYEAVSNSVA